MTDASMDERLCLGSGVAPTHIKGADTLRTIEFVGGQGDEVCAHVVYVERDLSNGLNCVGVE